MNESFLFYVSALLGGGIAMITGAQTNIPSVGVSGPNNMIS
jgi:hypothetical protein